MNHGRVVAGTLGAFAALVVFVGWRVVPGIEENLESSVIQALAQRGIEAASITAVGRTINVVGGPESPEKRLILAAAARSVPGVRRVRSPLNAASGGAWQLDPVRVAQAERDEAEPRSRGDDVPGFLETGPDHAAAESGSGGAGGGPDPTAVPAAAPATTTPSPGRGSVESLAADADAAAGTEASPAPAPTSDPDPTRATEPLPVGCEARLTVLAEGRTLVFARGEASLAEEDRRALQEIASVLGGCGEWTLTIVGYGGDDERDGADSWELADRRAYAVARYLTSRGIDASRLATVAGSAAFDEVGEPRAEIYVTGGL